MSQKNNQNLQEFCSIIDSRVTNASTQLKCYKKLDLKCCRSIVSVSDDVEHKLTTSNNRLQNKLFSKYLMSKNHQRRREDCLQKMRYFYYSTFINSKINMKVKQLSQEAKFQLLRYSVTDYEIRRYFINNWLNQMGYRSDKNKQYILHKIHLLIPNQLINEAIRFYENLGSQHFENQEQLVILENICSNGWEYFSGLMKNYVCSSNK